jgi:hypothetical protein
VAAEGAASGADGAVGTEAVAPGDGGVVAPALWGAVAVSSAGGSDLEDSPGMAAGAVAGTASAGGRSGSEPAEVGGRVSIQVPAAVMVARIANPPYTQTRSRLLGGPTEDGEETTEADEAEEAIDVAVWLREP